VTAIAIDNDQVRISSHEYQTLIDSLIRARDKLLELAGECSGCNGTGVVTLQERRRGLTVERQVDCEECGDIRECLR
jgi:hypothetical protein